MWCLRLSKPQSAELLLFPSLDLDDATLLSPPFDKSRIADICWANSELNLSSYSMGLWSGLSCLLCKGAVTSCTKAEDVAFISTDSHLVGPSILLHTYASHVIHQCSQFRLAGTKALLSNRHSRDEARNYTLGRRVLPEQVGLPGAGRATFWHGQWENTCLL